jgi:hypothetical protein
LLPALLVRFLDGATERPRPRPKAAVESQKKKKTQVEGTRCVCSSNRAPGLEYALVAR